MKLELLADNPESALKVAQWYFDEWASSSPGTSVEKVLSKISLATNRVKAPMLILAKEKDEVIGAAEFKIREMDIYPDYEFWLGGVYVEEKHRKSGVGSLLVTEVINRAKLAGVKKLYLQTENLSGGLYSKHGFEPIEEVEHHGYHVLVMVCEINKYNYEKG